MSRAEKIWWATAFICVFAFFIAGIVKVSRTRRAMFTPQSPAGEELATPLAVDHIFVVHDDKRGVTCYVSSGRGSAISCVPDIMTKIQ